jgi:uncharacterized protein YndB with AHSA1/START domain
MTARRMTERSEAARGEAVEGAAAGAPAERVLVLEREYDAPRNLVFKAWTDAAHLARWWGPKGFQVLSWKADARPGGRFRFGMRSPEGQEHWAHGIYREVVAPGRLVFTTAWEHPDGSPKHETVVTIILTERGGKTKLRFHQAIFDSETARDLHRGGWNSTFDSLADYLAAL